MSKLSEMMNKAAAQLSETTSQLSEMAASTAENASRLAQEIGDIANETAQGLMSSDHQNAKPLSYDQIYEVREGAKEEHKDNIKIEAEVKNLPQQKLFNSINNYIKFSADPKTLTATVGQITEQLEKGADPLLKDKDGKTAFDHLAGIRDTTIKDILTQHVIGIIREKSEVGAIGEKSEIFGGENPISIPVASTVKDAVVIATSAKEIKKPTKLPSARAATYRVPIAEAVSARVVEEVTIAPLDKATIGKAFVKGNPLKSQAQRQQ